MREGQPGPGPEEAIPDIEEERKARLTPFLVMRLGEDIGEDYVDDVVEIMGIEGIEIPEDFEMTEKFEGFMLIVMSDIKNDVDWWSDEETVRALVEVTKKDIGTQLTDEDDSRIVGLIMTAMATRIAVENYMRHEEELDLEVMSEVLKKNIGMNVEKGGFPGIGDAFDGEAALGMIDANGFKVPLKWYRCNQKIKEAIINVFRDVVKKYPNKASYNEYTNIPTLMIKSII